jgi:hypothetical protein
VNDDTREGLQAIREALQDISEALQEWLAAILGLAHFATYIMAAIRWFATDHYSFWHGFKGLLWALCPLINFAYVWIGGSRPLVLLGRPE